MNASSTSPLSTAAVPVGRADRVAAKGTLIDAILVPHFHATELFIRVRLRGLWVARAWLLAIVLGGAEATLQQEK